METIYNNTLISQNFQIWKQAFLDYKHRAEKERLEKESKE
jgi:hypothetical protein